MVKKKSSFEDNLKELEELMDEMESGKLSLDESIKSFEDGVKLYKECKVYLEKAEKKVETLSTSLKGNS